MENIIKFPKQGPARIPSGHVDKTVVRGILEQVKKGVDNGSLEEVKHWVELLESIL